MSTGYLFWPFVDVRRSKDRTDEGILDPQDGEFKGSVQPRRKYIAVSGKDPAAIAPLTDVRVYTIASNKTKGKE